MGANSLNIRTKSEWLVQMRSWKIEVTAVKKDTIRTACAQVGVTGKP